MKLSTIAQATFFASFALAAPVFKRDVVTQVVHQTRVFYQKQVVYVDQNGSPVTTSLELVGVSTLDEQPATTEAPAAVPTTTPTVAAIATTSAANANFVATDAVQAVSTSAVPAPSTTEATTPTPVPTTSEAPVAPSTTEAPAVPSTTEAPPAPSTTEAPPAPSTTEAPPAPSTTEAPEVPSTTEAPPAPSTTEAPVVPSTTEAPAAPSTTEAPAVTSTSEDTPAPSSTFSTGGSGEGSFTGDGTFYATGLGACGITNTDTDYIVAISQDMFNSAGVANPNANPYCGRTLTASRNGKSVKVTVTDSCPGCSYDSLDFSPAAFDQIATPDEGRVTITWSWDS